MLTGLLTVRSELYGNGVTFPSFDLAAPVPGVNRISLEAPDGHYVLLTVHFKAVADHQTAIALASRLAAITLNRLSFHRAIALTDPRLIGHSLTPVNPPHGAHIRAETGSILSLGQSVGFVVGINPHSLKSTLERASLNGEQYFGLFRSALLSSSPVETFLHLYNLLLMLFGDSQSAVDTFICNEEPSVPRTQHPMKKPGVTETLYTRLRNEFAHARPGVDINNTKATMTNHWGNLRDLTRKAIETTP